MKIKLISHGTSVNKWALGALCLICSIIFFLNSPIRWWSGLIDQASHCKVILSNVSGSLLRGEAHLSLGQTDQGSCKKPEIISQTISWNTSCILSKMSCQIHLSSAHLPHDLFIDLSWGQINLQAFKLNLPAEMLVGLGSPWNTIQFRGDIDVSAQNMIIKSNQINGEFNIEIKELKSALSKIEPLGSYLIKASFLNDSKIKVSTVEGPLFIDGEGSIINNQFKFSGEAKSVPEYRDALIGLLSVMGKNQGEVTKLYY